MAELKLVNACPECGNITPGCCWHTGTEPIEMPIDDAIKLARLEAKKAKFALGDAHDRLDVLLRKKKCMQSSFIQEK